jgi:phage/plasmid-like protein (TIGR03299 family)
MSHEITSTDGLVLAGQPAWHGLGTVLPDAPTTVDAFRLAGLGWTVDERPIYRRKFHGPAPEEFTYEYVKTHKELVRGDTGDHFGIVTKGYTLLQNEGLARLIDGLAADGCIPKAESAGSLKGGRRVFFLAQVGTFLAGPRDRVHEYLLFSNAHDGTAAFRVTPTTVRVVCHNTLSAALDQAEKSGEDLIRIPHTAGLTEAVLAARPRILQALAAGKVFRTKIEALAGKAIDTDGQAALFERIAARIWPDRMKLAAAGDAAAMTKMQDTLRAWVQNLLSPRNTDTGSEGTVWHALNAVTEWAEFERKERTGSDRVFSRMFGGAADIKAVALAEALKVLA